MGCSFVFVFVFLFVFVLKVFVLVFAGRRSVVSVLARSVCQLTLPFETPRQVGELLDSSAQRTLSSRPNNTLLLSPTPDTTQSKRIQRNTHFHTCVKLTWFGVSRTRLENKEFTQTSTSVLKTGVRFAKVVVLHGTARYCKLTRSYNRL